jgi:NitT/TauT family transport system substrate-binding protein
MKRLKLLVCATILFVVAGVAGAQAAQKFTIGFQPYDTISYQAIVNMEKGLWKQYVPKGVEIVFEPALRGTIIANNMLADKAVAGYMSVMPATILASKVKEAEFKMVASLGMSEGTRCSVVMVRKDAPEFKSTEELARWMDGKIIAAPKGSASDQFMLAFFAKWNVKPKEYLNQSIEVIPAQFRAGNLDAAALWEPTMSRIADDVGEGLVRLVADGRTADNPDLGILIMRRDFIEKHPEVAKGYLRSELEAQRFLVDPKNQEEVIKMVAKHAKDIPLSVLWYSIYGHVPSNSENRVREWKNFYFGDRELANIKAVAPFLHSEKRIDIAELPDWVVDDSIAREVFKEAGHAPVLPDAALGNIIGGLPADVPAAFTGQP